MSAGVETFEVLLTATIGEVFGQFLFSVVSRDSPLGCEISKSKMRNLGQFCGFAEGQHALRAKRKGKFTAQARFRLAFWEAKAAGNGIRPHGP